MFVQFEKAYLNKYWELQTAQWCNYFEDGNYNLNEIDKQIYDIVKLYSKKILPIDRKGKVASLIIQKDLIDKSPLVSEIRNRIDNIDNYNYGISEDIKTNRYKYKSALADKMKDDVAKLINARNTLAKQMSFKSYPDLVLNSEEINMKNLINSLNKFLEDNLSKAKELIDKYNIKWESWFDDLKRMGSTNNAYNPTELVEKLFSTLGFDAIKDRIKIDFKEKGFSGCAAEVSPNDIKIVVEPIKSLYNLKTLFHEVGHAILYALNEESGIYRVLTPSYDEGMAVVMECIAPILLLNKCDSDKIYEMITLEYTRCAISALYEFELWQDIDKAEELYIKHYSKLGIEINNPSIWASDTFRSIDAVYIHNYVIGALLSKKIINYLQGKYSENYKEWGYWLFENIYKDGRGRSFKEKIKLLGDFI